MKSYIKKIEWDRIYLLLHVEQEGDVKYYLKSRENEQLIPILFEKGIVKVNITNLSDTYEKFMLDEGTYDIVYESDNGITPVILCEEEYSNIENLDKVFPYGENKYAYVVQLESYEQGEDMAVSIKVSYMMKNPKPNSPWREKGLKNFLVRLFVSFFRAEYAILSKIYRKKGNRILLMSETKAQIAGNLKTINERIKNHEKAKEWTVSHSFCEVLNSSTLKTGVYWLKLIPLLAKQAVILVDDYCPVFKYLDLHPSTTLIQVWHAGVGFKSVGYSRFGKKDSPDPISSCHRKYDYVVVGSKNLIPVYQEVFGLSKEHFLPFGMARVDDYILGMEQEKEHLWKGKEVILFAPTYRGGGQKEAYYPYEKLDMKELYELCGEDRVFLFKMHPFIKKLPDIPEQYKERLVDVSHEDMNEMLQICDVLITDYSSVIYEFALKNKPILFYVFDKELYKSVRGFHWDFDAYAPGEICTSFEELKEAIDERKYNLDKVKNFVEFGYDYTDAGSTNRLIDFIEEKMKK